MKIVVKLRFSDNIKFSGKYESLKQACEKNSADLRGANLYGADLRSADLRGANLYGADLYGANLYGANLYGADLYGANLYGANLRGADLRGANLRSADLRSADLRGADLCGANLYGANLYGADGKTIKIYQSPIFISGLPNWEIMIAGDFMQIGCETHLIKDWAKFKSSRIKLMDEKATAWWKVYKPMLLALGKQHAAEHAKLAKKA